MVKDNRITDLLVTRAAFALAIESWGAIVLALRDTEDDVDGIDLNDLSGHRMDELRQFAKNHNIKVVGRRRMGRRLELVLRLMAAGWLRGRLVIRVRWLRGLRLF